MRPLTSLQILLNQNLFRRRAATVCCPVVEVGTVKMAENPPVRLVLVNTTFDESKVMRTSESGSKLIPATFTEVPTCPNAGSIVITGFEEKVTVKVAESEFIPSAAATVCGPGTEIGTSMFASKFPLLSVEVNATLDESKVMRTSEN